MSKKDDSGYMLTCFKLAEQAAGFVSPNPLVGAVIVKNNQIYATGYHKAFGAPHAEADAISKLNSKQLQQATLYCNLEPCCHTPKKTPPCAQLIIKSGIKKVVIANRDPNPHVAGKGIALLKKSGIEVVEGVEEAKGAELNRFFFKHISKQKPWVTVKIAHTLNGFISKTEAQQTWITGAEAKKEVHSMRAQHDAVLVGAGTVISDNPLLTVREVDGPDPIKIVIDGALSTVDSNAVLLNSAKTWLFYNKNIDKTQVEKLKKHPCKAFPLPVGKNGKLDLCNILEILGSKNINSVLVEGGRSIFTQFVEENLFDRLVIIQAGKMWPNGVKALNLQHDKEFLLHKVQQLGNDILLEYKKQ